MSRVFYSSPTNSTFFTSCCQLAICDDQQKCPGCKKDVYPFYEGMTDKERAEADGGGYHNKVRMSRSSMARNRS